MERIERRYSDIFTCRVLPGGHTHEYTVISSQHIITIWDSLTFVFLVIFSLLYRDKAAYLAPLLIFGWIWLKSKSVKQESLLVMRDIGIQVKTTYWSGRTESKFINRLKIENVIINEGIALWQVRPYLAIMVKNQERMMIVFENLLPPLHPVLLTTYCGTRKLLFSLTSSPAKPSVTGKGQSNNNSNANNYE